MSRAASHWQAPFILGCTLGLSVGGACWLWQQRREERRLWNLRESLQQGARKKAQKKHLRRGDGPPDADRPASEASDVSREVLCEDALLWLEAMGEQGLPAGCCVLTGVPDIHEVDPEGKNGIDEYQKWFQRVVELVLTRIPEGSLAIFMQTDVKVQSEHTAVSRLGNEGCYWRWLDKSYLAISAMERVPGARLLWHKIIFAGLVGGGGGRNSSVAGYSHFLCFTKGEKPEPLGSFPFPDVLRKGLSTWVAGSGAQALEEVCTYLVARGCSLVVDPFCGEGAVLAVANALGIGALGVELSKKRAKLALRQDGARLLAADRRERPPGSRGAL